VEGGRQSCKRGLAKPNHHRLIGRDPSAWDFSPVPSVLRCWVRGLHRGMEPAWISVACEGRVPVWTLTVSPPRPGASQLVQRRPEGTAGLELAVLVRPVLFNCVSLADRDEIVKTREEPEDSAAARHPRRPGGIVDGARILSDTYKEGLHMVSHDRGQSTTETPTPTPSWRWEMHDWKRRTPGIQVQQSQKNA
jgi:hypothetical protein